MKKILITLILGTMLFTCSMGATLFDIDGHWATLSIIQATNRSIFNGYPDGTFKPDNTITRLEFITIMTKLLDNVAIVDIDNYDNIFKYDDLDEDSWGYPIFNKLMYYAHVFSDERADDIKGKNLAIKVFGDTLEPNKPITREEAVALMAAFLDDSKLSGDELIFTDILDSVYKYDIQKFCKTGIIQGYPDGTFKPKNNITRAEASVIIVQLLSNRDFIKNVEWKIESRFPNHNIYRTEPGNVVYLALFNESIGKYAEAYQYLSPVYKEKNGITTSNYYKKISDSHLIPVGFSFDENTIKISPKKEKDGVIEVEFNDSELKEKYLLELVLIGPEDWYINSKNY